MTSTTFFIIFIPILSVILLAVNLLLAPHNPYQEKDSAFECGFHSFLGQNRTQFSVSFFIFGLLFLLFDLEILLVYPYSVSSYTNDIYGLGIMLLFFVLLTLGFIFELGKGALVMDSKQTSVSNNNNNSSPTIDSFILLQSGIFKSSWINIGKLFLNHYLVKINQYIVNFITFKFTLLFLKLFDKYPSLFIFLDKLASFVNWIILPFIHFFKHMRDYFGYKYPLAQAFILYLYSEFIYLLSGNLNRIGLGLISLYVIYGFDMNNLLIYFILLVNLEIKKFLEHSIWFKSKYPTIQNLSLKVTIIINICIVAYFINSMYIELILPLLRSILNSIVNMAGPSNTSTGNGSSSTGGPESGGPTPGGDPNSGGTPPGGDPNVGGDTGSLNTTRKSKKRSKKNISIDEYVREHNVDKKELLLGFELERVRGAYNDYCDIEAKHENLKELYVTFGDFTDKYLKWLPKEDKERIYLIRLSLNTLDTNEKNGNNINAPNMLTLWKNIKQDAKGIHQKYTQVAQIFEKNSKKIQNDNLGGTSSDNSKIFRKDLAEMKDVYAYYNKRKMEFLNDQMNKSGKIDSMLKEKKITIRHLYEKEVLG